MSYTLWGQSLLSPLLGDEQTAQVFSMEADLASMVKFEAALARAEAAYNVIAPETAEAIEAACRTFEPDVNEIAKGVVRDGVAVPAFVKLLRAHVGPPHAERVHFGATSQDLIDTSLTLRLKQLCPIFETRLQEAETGLAALSAQYGDRPLMARTRMQAAIPITVRDRIRAWQAPLATHRERLERLKPDLLRVQFGGAAGNLHSLGDQADAVVRALAAELALNASPQWHADRSAIAEFANWLSMVTGSLGKLGQDAALMAQTGINELEISGAGGSSAMQHKRNPIKAETLVTLARFNATCLAGMHQSMIHEQERSGAAWTLEWMLLPQMAIATGASLRIANELIRSIRNLGDLDKTRTSLSD